MPEGNGRAYIAPWIIKILAGIFLAGSVAWADMITRETLVQKVRVDIIQRQLDRIEQKLDMILERLPR